MNLLKASLVGFIVTVLAIYLLKPLAVRIGLVDHPDERKLHHGQIPLIGGIAILCGFCFALLTLDISFSLLRGLLASAGILVFIGVLDDFHNISSKIRLLGQIIAALLLIIWSQVSVNQLGDLFFLGNISLGLWALPFTVLLVVANLNAINMIDGQDGLAGSVLLVQAVFLLGFAIFLKIPVITQLLVIIIALLVAFLLFNMPFPWRRRASIFLGDAGSTLLGLLLIAMAIIIAQHRVATLKPITVLWVMAFPLLDLFNVVIHRIIERRSVIVAGRDHLHHVLHIRGFSTSLSNLLLSLFSIMLGLIGLLFYYLSVAQGIQLMLMLLLVVVYCWIIKFSRTTATSRNN